MADRQRLRLSPRADRPLPEGLRCSPSCERNAAPIARVLAEWLTTDALVLEIGCGTGQHAAYMTDVMRSVRWLPTDLQLDRKAIGGWAATSIGADRILRPQALDVMDSGHWQPLAADALFTANTLHIMPWQAVEAMFASMRMALAPLARLCLYGPFHQQGVATSESNARFDAQLRAANNGMGIRDLERVQALAALNGWLQLAHYAMPANNQMLIFGSEQRC